MKGIALVLLGCAALAAAKTYEGYKVISVLPRNEHQLDWLNKLRSLHELDFWTEPRGVGIPIDIMIPPYLDHISQILRDQDITSKINIRDIQSIIDEQSKPKKMPRVTTRHNLKIDHTVYRNLDEINQVLDELVSNNGIMSAYEGSTTTLEGRSFKIIQVSTDGGNTKPVIWIDCGIHAREWISPATCQYILDVLSSDDADAASVLEMYDFHVLTNTNPDGFEFTWSSDRLWRKNRHDYGLCFGTDPNRNFDSDFGGEGTSNSPCSDIYHGESAFSERETQNVRDSLQALSGRVKAYISIHSYSQYWMTPYGYTHNLPANYDEQYRVAGIGVDALKAVHGKSFTYGNIADVIYMAAGGSSDWAFDTEGIEYSFSLELRDTGSYGFLLPAEQIIPVGEETYAGIVAAVKAMK